MALTNLNNNFNFPGLLAFSYDQDSFLPAVATGQTFTAVNQKLGFFGHIQHESRGASKTLDKIHFYCGALSSPVMTLTAGIQGIDTTTGPGANADGTYVRSGTLDMSTATADTWNSITVSAGATTTFSHGQEVAIVFDMTAVTSGSSIINVLGAPNVRHTRPQVNTHNATSWASTSSIYYPLVVLEFNDSGTVTYGTLRGSFIAQQGTAIGFGNATGTADEYALLFQTPIEVKADALQVVHSCASGANFDVILYDDPTGTPSALATVSVDANTVTVNATTGNAILVLPITETTLSANHTYAIALKPTTSAAIYTRPIQLRHADDRKLLPGGTTLSTAGRLDGSGAFNVNASTTSLFLFDVLVSAIHDGTGGGGGLLTHPGMTGGMNG